MNIGKFLLLSILVLSLSGCFEKRISCNDEAVQETIKEMTADYVVKCMIINENKKAQIDKNPFAQNISCLSQFAQTFFSVVVAKNTTKMSQTYNKLREDYNTNISFHMENFITKKTENDSNQVKCTASALYILDKYQFHSDMDYIIQETDDKQNVYVEVTAFTEAN